MTLLVTCSWDDGHPLDRRLADLLLRHGFGATFYCPLRNVEGHPVMSSAELRALHAQGFEIGSHTHDHVYASRTDPQGWADQVRRGKQGLEDILGVAVRGFCYPGGEHDASARQAVRASGFTHARTVDNLQLGCGTDPFRVPTTLQVFPHRRTALLRNYLGRGHWWKRLRPAHRALAQRRLDTRLHALLDHARQTGGVLHLWGHAWEIEQQQLWPLLEAFLSRVAAVVPREDRLGVEATLRRLQLVP